MADQLTPKDVLIVHVTTGEGCIQCSSALIMIGALALSGEIVHGQMAGSLARELCPTGETLFIRALMARMHRSGVVPPDRAAAICEEVEKVLEERRVAEGAPDPSVAADIVGKA